MSDPDSIDSFLTQDDNDSLNICSVSMDIDEQSSSKVMSGNGNGNGQSDNTSYGTK